MAEWVRGLIAPDVAEAHSAWLQLIEATARLELVARNTPAAAAAAARLSQVRVGYKDFNDELRATAILAAQEAVKGARERLASTQLRPDTGVTPHLRDLIVAAPINTGAVQTGTVGIGRIATLNRAVNRNTPGYGTYWRAQEYGTGSEEVPSQVGRVIFGSFAKAGSTGLTRPLADYAFGGGGPHPIFLPSRSGGGGGSPSAVLSHIGRVMAMPSRSSAALAGAGGADVGWGTIGVEDQPRRFLSAGADLAAVVWRRRMAETQARALERLAAIGV